MFQGEDLGVLRGLKLPLLGGQGGGAGVAVRGRGGVGGGDLGGAAGAEDVPGEEQGDYLIQAGPGGLDGAGWPGLAAACRGFFGLCGHW